MRWLVGTRTFLYSVTVLSLWLILLVLNPNLAGLLLICGFVVFFTFFPRFVLFHLEQLDQPIIITDKQGTILYVSSASEARIGRQVHHLVHEPVQPLLDALPSPVSIPLLSYVIYWIPTHSYNAWEAITKATPVTIMTTDRKGVIHHINYLSGSTRPQELIGVSIYDLVPAHEVKSITQKVEQVFTTGQALYYEIEWPQRDANAWYGVHLTPLNTDLVVFIALTITGHKHVEYERNEQDQIMKLFIEHSPAAIAMFDTDMRYIAYSRRWLADYGLGDDNLIGKGHYEVFPEIGGEWKAVHQRCLAGAIERQEFDRFDRADGSVAWVKWEVRPWRRHSGEIGGLIMFTEVVTEQKLAQDFLETTLKRLSVLIANLQDGILVENEDREVVIANQAFCDIFGIKQPPDTLIGQDYASACEEGKALFVEPEQFTMFTDNAVEQKVIVTNEVFEMVDGHTLERDYIPIWLEDDYRGHMWHYRDITEFKHTQEILEDARDQALEASRLKSEFLATMSHEIRTPMNGILGMTELLLESGLDQEQLEFALTVQNESNHLLKLLSAILDFAKIEAGKAILETTPFDPQHLVKSVVDRFEPLAREKGLSIHAEIDDNIPTWVEGDVQRIEMVLNNLVDNAIKFTDIGVVTIRVNWEDGLRFEVDDTGVGLPDNAGDWLFQPFRQADGSMTRRYGGIGLGLALSRSLVELMHGEIGFDLDQEVGALFWFVVDLDLLPDSTD